MARFLRVLFLAARTTVKGKLQPCNFSGLVFGGRFALVLRFIGSAARTPNWTGSLSADVGHPRRLRSEAARIGGCNPNHGPKKFEIRVTAHRLANISFPLTKK